ncbi:MAG: DUF2703 domain-containing protein [Patescibacteria group bacterium]
MAEPNEGIELLYTRDCQNWQQTLVNLKQALNELHITDSMELVPIDTIEQARIYNFFASPTIHINGQDADSQSRRTGKRGMGTGRPYFFKGKAWSAPPKELIIKALKDLYLL